MATPDTTLVRAFKQLQRATTPTARRRAAALVYVLAHPGLTRRCDALLAIMAPGHWSTGEDLSSETLLAVLLQPSRVQACRQTTADGIHAFLRRAAYFGLLDDRDMRARRTRGVVTERLGPALLGSVAVSDTEEPACEDSADFWPVYSRALRRLSDAEQRAWVCCVEQEMPMTELARSLGVNRTTIWRQVQLATAHFRLALQPVLDARRRDAAQRVILPPDRPVRGR